MRNFYSKLNALVNIIGINLLVIISITIFIETTYRLLSTFNSCFSPIGYSKKCNFYLLSLQPFEKAINIGLYRVNRLLGYEHSPNYSVSIDNQHWAKGSTIKIDENGLRITNKKIKNLEKIVLTV
mgnify:FL=1|tara:strand:- start:48 stop:422 length:375 start_codon:yes stop_codon:yes gene_type:complete